VVPDTTYARQVLYVDTARFVPLKLELYARGGRLLKVMDQMDFRYSQGRWYPAEIVIRDTRRQNSKTTIRFSSMSFNVGVPKSVFTKRNLRR
jgi:outer membrane lipoprotein-sorting protein